MLFQLPIDATYLFLRVPLNRSLAYATGDSNLLTMPKEAKAKLDKDGLLKKPKYLEKALKDFDPLAIAAQVPGDGSQRSSKKSVNFARFIDIEAFKLDPMSVTPCMADVVVTVLSNHGSETMEAFLDFRRYPDFTFRGQKKTKESPRLTIIRGTTGDDKVEVKVCYRKHW